MGRRKIEMKLVKDSSARQVTFSKRRTGIFKKANELAILCAVELAIVVFSPGGKPFSFGHPNIESVARRFLNDEPNKESSGPSGSRKDKARLAKLIQQHNDLLKQLCAEQKRGEMLNQAMEENKSSKFFKPVDQLSLDELTEFQTSLEDLGEKLKARVTEIEASSSLLLLSKNDAAKQDDK